MTFRPTVSFVVLLLVTAITGCASSAPTPARSGQPAHPASATANTPVPYALYTHCGIDEANIGGRWFEADHPLSDGNGNPPPGWGNPDQPGTIIMLSASTAEFRDSLGHIVRFHLLVGATGPRHTCALRQYNAAKPGWADRGALHSPANVQASPRTRDYDDGQAARSVHRLALIAGPAVRGPQPLGSRRLI